MNLELFFVSITHYWLLSSATCWNYLYQSTINPIDSADEKYLFFNVENQLKLQFRKTFYWGFNYGHKKYFSI